MIVLVGDKPSKENLDPNVAFVGTKSYKTLLNWIADMDVNIAEVKLINKDQITECKRSDCFIALGGAAEKIVKNLNLNYFKLPHPSGLNRVNNDKKKLAKKLLECKDWLKIANWKDPLHVPSAEYTVSYKGKEVLTLNKRLIDQQNVWENLDVLKALHVIRLRLEEQMKIVTDRETAKKLCEAWTNNQFDLQRAWKFPEDAKFHMFWAIEGCGCPKMDNRDAYPSGHYVISAGCKLHGWEVPKQEEVNY